MFSQIKDEKRNHNWSEILFFQYSSGFPDRVRKDVPRLILGSGEAVNALKADFRTTGRYGAAEFLPEFLHR